MNHLLNLLAALVGWGCTFLVLSEFALATPLIRFAVAATCIYLVSHAFFWFDAAMLRRKGCLLVRKKRRDRVVGHVMAALGAVSTGYAFAAGNKMVLLAFLLISLVLLRLAQSRLTPHAVDFG